MECSSDARNAEFSVSQEELCALGQHCKLFFGHSRMYDLIKHNLDLHGMFAAYRDGKLHGYDLANLTDQQVADLREMLKFYKEDPNGKKARKLAKVANRPRFHQPMKLMKRK